jgi:hypothetical protein
MVFLTIKLDEKHGKAIKLIEFKLIISLNKFFFNLFIRSILLGLNHKSKGSLKILNKKNYKNKYVD